MRADSLSSEPPGKPKNTGVSSLSPLQKILLIQESSWGLLHCRRFFTSWATREAWISYMCMQIPFPLDLLLASLHPTPLGHHKHWAELPELYSMFPLAIYFTYGDVSMSILISRFVPPSPSQVALVVKKPPARAGVTKEVGLIPGLGRSPGGGHGNALQYSCLEHPMDRGAWSATVHGSQRVGHDQGDLVCPFPTCSPAAPTCLFCTSVSPLPPWKLAHLYRFSNTGDLGSSFVSFVCLTHAAKSGTIVLLETQCYFSWTRRSEQGTLIHRPCPFKLLKEFFQVSEHRGCVLKCFCSVLGPHNDLLR